MFRVNAKILRIRCYIPHIHKLTSKSTRITRILSCFVYFDIIWHEELLLQLTKALEENHDIVKSIHKQQICIKLVTNRQIPFGVMDWVPCYSIYVNELMRALEQSYSTRHWSQFFWLFADDLVPLSTKTKGLQQHLPAHSVRKIMILWKRHSSIQFKIICIALFTKQSLQSNFTGN